jgi:cytohesin
VHHTKTLTVKATILSPSPIRQKVGWPLAFLLLITPIFLFSMEPPAQTKQGTTSQVLRPDVSAVNQPDAIFLQAAADGNDHKILEAIEAKANLLCRDKNGCTALHYAAANGHLATVRLLLDKKIPIDSEDRIKRTPLHYAAARGHRNVVELLLARGANRESQDNRYRSYGGETILTLSNGRQIIDRPGDSLPGSRPLHLAAQAGHAAVVRYLLQNGSQTKVHDYEGDTPLHLAAAQGHAEIITLLLEAGAPIHATNRQQETALRSAQLNRHDRVMLLLLQQGATCQNSVSLYKDILFRAIRENLVDLIQQILDREISLVDESMIENGLSPFEYACERASYKTFSFIFNNIPSSVLTSPRGNNAVLLAAQRRDGSDIVNFLLRQGAQTNFSDTDNTILLHHASSTGNLEAVNLLLSKGADVNCLSKKLATPLHQAALRGHLPVAEALLTANAFINMQDAAENTPFDFVAQGYTDAINSLNTSNLDRWYLEGQEASETEKNEGSTHVNNRYVGLARLFLIRGALLQTQDIDFLKQLFKDKPLLLALLEDTIDKQTQSLITTPADNNALDEALMAAVGQRLSIISVLIPRVVQTLGIVGLKAAQDLVNFHLKRNDLTDEERTDYESIRIVLDMPEQLKSLTSSNLQEHYSRLLPPDIQNFIFQLILPLLFSGNS